MPNQYRTDEGSRALGFDKPHTESSCRAGSPFDRRRCRKAPVPAIGQLQSHVGRVFYPYRKIRSSSAQTLTTWAAPSATVPATSPPYRSHVPLFAALRLLPTHTRSPANWCRLDPVAFFFTILGLSGAMNLESLYLTLRVCCFRCNVIDFGLHCEARREHHLDSRPIRHSPTI